MAKGEKRQHLLAKIVTALTRPLAQIAKLMFHRLGIISSMIVLQIAFYVMVLAELRNTPYFHIINTVLIALSAFAVLWIVSSRSNPGYKMGWIIIVLLFLPFGVVAYLLLGGNRLSRYNQRRLRSMERTVRANLGPECGRW